MTALGETGGHRLQATKAGKRLAVAGERPHALAAGNRQRMRSHGLDDGLCLADGSGEFKAGARMTSAEFVEKQRNVALQVTTPGNEHRQDDDAFETLAKQGFGALAQAGLDELQESQFDAQFGGLLAQRRANATHGLGPFGVTRTVRKFGVIFSPYSPSPRVAPSTKRPFS